MMKVSVFYYSPLVLGKYRVSDVNFNVRRRRSFRIFGQFDYTKPEKIKEYYRTLSPSIWFVIVELKFSFSS